MPIHVSFKWDSSDPDYDSPSTSVANDDGSVAGDNDDVADDDGSAVTEDDINEISSSKPNDCDDGTASHSTLSIYPDHRDAGYSWTAYIKEARGYHHLMQHSHRIATLDISLPAPGDDEDEEDNPLAYGLLFYPFPALQTLKLRCFQGSHGSIPTPILDEHITTVNSLVLENIFPTQIIDFSLSLTSLTLRTTGANVINADLFLQFLKKNCNLWSLTIHDYKFHPISDSATPVTLNNLRQLDVLNESVTFLRHIVAPPLGPQSFFRIERISRCLSLLAENSTSGTSTSASRLLPSIHPDPDEFLSLISEVFGSGWEKATEVVVAIPIGGWERKLVDKFLDALTSLSDLSLEYHYDRADPWFDSLAASKERCPKLRKVRLLYIASEYCPTAVRSVRKLVKRRAEDGIPLEVIEQIGLSPSEKGLWDDLYDRWRIKDYLRTRDS